jgi:hypothetical protein
LNRLGFRRPRKRKRVMLHRPAVKAMLFGFHSSIMNGMYRKKRIKAGANAQNMNPGR